MAKKNIENLDEDTSLANSDLLLVAEDIGGGAYVSKKAQISNIIFALPTVEAVTASPRAVTAADNGKLLTNQGAVVDIVFNMDTKANLGSSFKVGIVNEVGVNTPATGGTITTLGSDTIHTFTANGNFVAYGPMTVRVLLVGGGGSSAFTQLDVIESSGGGGGGEVLEYTNVEVGAGTRAVVVGAGGIARNEGSNGGYSIAGATGSSSTFNGLTARGGVGSQPGHGAGHTGGANGAGTYIGGVGGPGGANGGGGGAGSGANGSNSSGTNGGAGGNGSTSTIYDDTTRYYGGGGGGGSAYNNGGAGGAAGGLGGGGKGANGFNGQIPKDCTAGTANTGGGGGGQQYYQGYFAGGSGIVIIRYATLSSSTVKIAPASGEQLPGTTAADRLLVSDSIGDMVELRAGGSALIAENGKPSNNGWVDTAP